MFSRIFTFAEVHTHNLVFWATKKCGSFGRDTELGKSGTRVLEFWILSFGLNLSLNQTKGNSKWPSGCLRASQYNAKKLRQRANLKRKALSS